MSEKQPRIIFMGTPDYAVPTLRKLCETGMKPVLVMTRPDAPAGRGNKITASPVKIAAEEYGIPVYQPVTLRSAEAYEYVKQYGADLAVVIAYGMLLPQEMLDLPVHGCVNLHASLLPRFRGAAPIQRAIMAGDEKTGVALMKMTAGLDEGPVYAVKTIDITQTMDTGELHDALAKLSAEIMAENISAVMNDELALQEQDHASATYAAKITKADELIQWNQTSFETLNRVRGLSPFPGAFTYLEGKRLKVWKAKRADLSAPPAAPGTVVFGSKGELLVCTADGGIEILELQLEGKKRMLAGQFLQGIKKDNVLILKTSAE